MEWWLISMFFMRAKNIQFWVNLFALILPQNTGGILPQLETITYNLQGNDFQPNQLWSNWRNSSILSLCVASGNYFFLGGLPTKLPLKKTQYPYVLLRSSVNPSSFKSLNAYNLKFSLLHIIRPRWVVP